MIAAFAAAFCVPDDGFAAIPFSSVTTGASHTCAVSNNQIYCWGRNNHGQLGDGTSTDRHVPTLVQLDPGPAGIWGLAAGENHTCAIVAGANNRVYCWGQSFIGEHLFIDKLTPEAIAWGPPPASPLSPPPQMTPIVWIAAGGGHTCVWGEGDDTWCWGENSTGALGDGSTSDRPWAQPVQSPGERLLNPVAGRQHTCAIGSATSNIYCWGDNSFGQLGDGSTAGSLAPEHIANFGTISMMAGPTHTCVALYSGGSRCWGSNGSGELGDGTTVQRFVPTPGYPPADTIGWMVATGLAHTCAINAFEGPGTLYCWGDNGSGQLGNGSFANSAFPIEVSALGNKVVGSSTTGGGLDFTCAITSDSNLWCWGGNSFGQLGDGTTTAHSSPTRVIVEPPPVPALPRWGVVGLASLLVGAASLHVARRRKV
jgi:alpha-tubulin suppressor-like RCC1 family protein